jgi:hypothetical protein
MITLWRYISWFDGSLGLGLSSEFESFIRFRLLTLKSEVHFTFQCDTIGRIFLF